MNDKGSFTVAQDEISSEVFGMPQKDIALGAVDNVKSLNDIPRAIMRFIQSENFAKV